MKYFQKLKGERLYLSPINAKDFETYTKWMNDSDITDRLGNSWVLYDVEKETEFLTTAGKSDYHFAMIEHDGDRLLGNVSLFNINPINQTADFGIFIGEKSDRGKGYGFEAGKLILNYGFNVLNLNNIILRVFEFNSEAVACYERLGFKTLGRRRSAYFVNGRFYDEIYMDILREELFQNQ